MFEVKSKLPQIKPKKQNISQIKDLNVLINQYPNQRVIPQFIQLKQQYPKYRSVKGDGNCFYRAFAFLYLRQSDLSSFDSVFKRIRNVCTNNTITYDIVSFQEALYQLYQNDIKPFSKLNKKERQQKLMQKFNSSQMFDNILILYFRSLNYFYLQNNIQKFKQFAHDDFESILRAVCKYSQQSEGIELNSLVNCLQLKLTIISVDQNQVIPYVYNQKCQRKQFTMFLRPGHYDILYERSSQFINEQPRLNFSQTPHHYLKRNFDFEKIQQRNIPSQNQNYRSSLFNRNSQKMGDKITNKISNSNNNQPKQQKSKSKAFFNHIEQKRQIQKKQSKCVKNKFKNSVNISIQNPGMAKIGLQAGVLAAMLIATYFVVTYF